MSVLKNSGKMVITEPKSLVVTSNTSLIKDGDESDFKFKKILETNETFNEANKILKERGKQKGALSIKPKFKSDYLKDCRVLNLKNYQIKLLKNERTSINDQEGNISDALKKNEINLDKDYKRFQEYMSTEKNLSKTNEQNFLDLIEKNHELIYKKDSMLAENKKLLEDLERLSKIIYNQQTHAKFVNNVLGGISYDNKQEMKTEGQEFSVEHLINEYNLIIKNDYLEDSEEMSKILKIKFIELEENILKMLEKKDQIEKELTIMSEENKKLKKTLQDKEEEVNNEMNKISEDREKENRLFHQLKDQMNWENDTKTVLLYIQELYKEFCEFDNNDSKLKSFKKKIETDRCDTIVKEFIDILKNKEHMVSKYIDELEEAKIKNSKVFIAVLDQRKEQNKQKKSKAQKEREMKITEEKRIKAEERSSRSVIKGRKVLPHNLVNKGRMTNKDNKKDKDNNDEGYFNYYD